MPSALTLTARFDNIIATIRAERQRIEGVGDKYGAQATEMMRDTAPKSEINEAGYVHFKDQFRVEKIAPLTWAIYNDKRVGVYWLWMLLEFGTRKMSPRKTVGPCMDRIGPQFLAEVGRFETR